MFQSKIVFIVTGSIAAYKSCDLISQLRKRGHQIRVILSPTAEKFVGRASFQALTGQPVYTDDFSPESSMSHIELGKWCDLTIVYPATAQTINSFACGIGHDLHHSYFLAYDFSKPFLIAPAMNTRMLKNPATQNSLSKLRAWGCEILQGDSGELACGEVGEGRLIEPEQTISRINKSLKRGRKQSKRILITAGGTRETIDGVRTLTNMSSGQTGATLADYLHTQGFQVLLLTSRFAQKPSTSVKTDTYESFRDIYNTLQALGKSHSFDWIFHAAAISDYSIDRIQTPKGEIEPGQNKMSSQFDNISISLKRNEKILPKLKDLFGKKTKVVGFKLTSTESREEQARAIFSLFTENSVDFVVHNDLNDINKGERKFLMTSKEGKQDELNSLESLADFLAQKIKSKEEKSHDLMP